MGLFKRKRNTVEIHACTTGQVIQLEELSDPVFSQKMMGDGIAILPEHGIITAPFQGVITSIFPTKHAIVISQGDVSILLHLGIDTVSLEGKPFHVHVQEGDQVQAGDILVDMDLSYLQEHQIDPTIISILLAEESGHAVHRTTAVSHVASQDALMWIE